MILNGVPNQSRPHDFDPPDRVLRLPSTARDYERPHIDIELLKTPEGGYRSWSSSYEAPHDVVGAASGCGHTVEEMCSHKSGNWVVELMWRRIVELEDELHTLKKAIAYKG